MNSASDKYSSIKSAVNPGSKLRATMNSNYSEENFNDVNEINEVPMIEERGEVMEGNEENDDEEDYEEERYSPPDVNINEEPHLANNSSQPEEVEDEEDYSEDNDHIENTDGKAILPKQI